MIKLKDILNEDKEQLKEGRTTDSVKFVIPSDVSYYDRDWGKQFEQLARSPIVVDYGVSESHMYEWNDQRNYDIAIKEYNNHMKKIAKKLNASVKELGDVYNVWWKIYEKHRKKDRS